MGPFACEGGKRRESSEIQWYDCNILRHALQQIERLYVGWSDEIRQIRIFIPSFLSLPFKSLLHIDI